MSGCRVARIGGDQTVFVAQLDFAAGPYPPPSPTYLGAVKDLGKARPI